MKLKQPAWFLIGFLVVVGLALFVTVQSRGDLRPDAKGALDTSAVFERPNQTELVVDLADGTTLATFLAKYPELKASQVRFNSPNVEDEAIVVVTVPAAKHADLLTRLRADGDLVEAAENNGWFRLPTDLSGAFDVGALRTIPDDDSLPPLEGFPNDPLYGKQWNMSQVNARDAWRYTAGADVIVAVIDTGVAYEDAKGIWAPDLQRTRFVPGYDFVNDDAIAADDHGHGTHCAGTIAQSTHNGRGVVGLAPKCKIMPLKVLSKQGWGTTSDIVDAIRFAADNGAHVISMSLGGGGYSKQMKAACDYARDKGVVVVAAAGNANRPRVEYPAAYPASLAVTSVGPSGERAFYSSYGKQAFIAAPGGDMRKGVEDGVLQNTIVPGGKKAQGTVYAYFQGTSMATPHVAAAAGLLYGAGVTRPDAIANILAKTARTDVQAWTPEKGHGILDAGAAVKHAIFVPSTLALLLGGVLVFVAGQRTPRQQLSRLLLAAGALFGACGLFFLRPFGLGELGLVGDLLTRSVADWGIALLGASWHWNALVASALIPFLIGIVSFPTRFTRSLAVGLCLGWSARLASGVVFSYADVRWIPGQGALDTIWLSGNAVACLLVAAALIRLGRKASGPAGPPAPPPVV